jgi:DNA polymerase-3 subunit gamma/tau
MVRTLGNAIASGRIAHAFLLTGVRGVGKTSTARLVAKALNCIGPDGRGGPTIDPCGQCEPCRAIAEGRHIDVTEMDAASHTGVDDVREIIEAVRYSAVSARFKIYIIDEVHMLTKNAFNALLKTLEEPPAHVKFLFATTEVNKVPVTVLSRCQRFDLRRIPAEKLVDHFRRIAEIEQVSIEPDALLMIARAAEGSARDGLSILDQAIAHGGGEVKTEAVRDMLGLADRGRVRRLLSLLLAGDASGSLTELDEAQALGIDPTALLRGLMEQVHAASRAKAGRGGDQLASVEERAASEELAGSLGWSQLHRLWQLLLKGLADVGLAPDPNEAAAMVLLRLVHAADLPDPAALIARLQGHGQGEGAVSAPAARADSRASATAKAELPAPTPIPASTPPTEPALALPATFGQLVDLLESKGKAIRAVQLRGHVGLIRFKSGELVLKPLQPLGANFARELEADLKGATGTSWRVTLGDGEAEPSLAAQERMDEERARDAILREPSVAAVLSAYPDATLESVSAKDANHA